MCHKIHSAQKWSRKYFLNPVCVWLSRGSNENLSMFPTKYMWNYSKGTFLIVSSCVIDMIILIALIKLSAAPEHKKLRRKVRIYSEMRFTLHLAHFLSRPTNNAVQIATTAKSNAELVSLFGWKFLWEQPLQKKITSTSIFWTPLSCPSWKIKIFPLREGIKKKCPF